MGDFNAYIMTEAAQLALNDAAFALWLECSRLESEEAVPPDRSNLNRFEDATLRRLKVAHPEAADQYLRGAVKAAIKFQNDCQRRFSYSKAGLLADAIRAVEDAKVDNPPFGEVTYDRARGKLIRTMR
jgi:hypothetical protein